MPTYVYKFIDSGETIDVYQAFTDEPMTELAHPQDGIVKPVKKVFTSVGVSFKGGGFYKTDSKSTSSKTTSASSGATDSSSTSTTTSNGSNNGSNNDSTAAPAATPAAAPTSTPASTPASTS